MDCRRGILNVDSGESDEAFCSDTLQTKWINNGHEMCFSC